MTLRRLILVLVALLAGGAALYLLEQGRTGNPQATVAASAPEAEILVATRPIGIGERLTPDMLSWTSWPANALRPDYVAKSANPDALATLTGALARFEIFEGEPILRTKLVTAAEGYLSAVLDKGRRAVAVSVTPADASGGYVMPNDRVDVVLTRTEGTGSSSRTLISNVKVLAIDRRLGEAGASGALPAGDPQSSVFQEAAIATLDLGAEEAVAVINGSRQGQLSLVLRALADGSDRQSALGRPAETPSGVRIIRFGTPADLGEVTPPLAVAAPAATSPGEVSSR